MQKHSRKAHQSVLEIIDRLLIFVSYNELKNYRKARAASKEATEICAQLDAEMYRQSPEGRKWFRSREYREYLREQKARK